jgi:hypothetical protein
MESCVTFLEGKLKPKVNRKKSTTGSPAKLKFPGYTGRKSPYTGPRNVIEAVY